jgi:hypothetical protein
MNKETTTTRRCTPGTLSYVAIGLLCGSSLTSTYQSFEISRDPMRMAESATIMSAHPTTTTAAATGSNAIPKKVADSEVESTKNILYVVRTYPGNYKRLSLQARSWMRHLDPAREAVMVASTETDGWTTERAQNETLMSSLHPLPVSFSTPYCVENNHGPGLCCQEAHALLSAANDDEYASYGWIFVIDEDVFVHPGIVRDIVQDNHNRTALSKGVAIGTPGCGADGYGGFCGGGGYLISRSAVQALVSLPHFYEDYMHMCRAKIQYCDVVTGWMMENRAMVTILSDPRFQPWGIGSAYDEPWLIRDGNESSKILPLISARLDRLKKRNSPKNQTTLAPAANSTGDRAPKRSVGVPSHDMYELLEESLSNSSSGLAAVMVTISARKIATLHYYGGPFVNLYYQALEDKIDFLQLLFDIASPVDSKASEDINGAEFPSWQ